MKRSKGTINSKREQKELRMLAALPDDAIDVSELREIASWKKATVGRFYRPIKQSVTLRLDSDVLAWLKTHHPKYQTTVNQILRDYVAGQSRRS